MASSVFGQLAASARQAHSDFFAQEADAAQVSIVVGSADPVPTTAVLHKQRTVTRREGGDTIRVTVRDCRLPQLTSIDHNAIVLIGDERWAIDEVRDHQGAGLNVQLARVETNTRSRSGYRGDNQSSNLSSRT